MDLGTAVASSWSSGISMYLVFSVLGIGGRLDWVDSPTFLQKPWVIAIALAMFVVELIVDKISYIDSTWDAVHTFLRPLAGALLLSSSDVSISTVVLALAGGALALSAHGAKASTRLLVNTSPDPVSNVVVSLMEDGLVAALDGARADLSRDRGDGGVDPHGRVVGDCVRRVPGRSGAAPPPP